MAKLDKAKRVACIQRIGEIEKAHCTTCMFKPRGNDALRHCYQKCTYGRELLKFGNILSGVVSADYQQDEKITFSRYQELASEGHSDYEICQLEGIEADTLRTFKYQHRLNNFRNKEVVCKKEDYDFYRERGYTNEEIAFFMGVARARLMKLIEEWRLSDVRTRKARPTKSKYNNKKTKVDEITFDSIAESKYYLHLKKRQQRGELLDFTLQPKFILIPKVELPSGETQRAIIYKADFLLIYPCGKEEIIDVKGAITKEFALKKKLFHYRFPEKHLLLVEYDAKKNIFKEK